MDDCPGQHHHHRVGGLVLHLRLRVKKASTWPSPRRRYTLLRARSSDSETTNQTEWVRANSTRGRNAFTLETKWHHCKEQLKNARHELDGPSVSASRPPKNAPSWRDDHQRPKVVSVLRVGENRRNNRD
ncbi:hypothetical protein PsorP6_016006 [Peronosclerospora sorghi]|uniref:Uncharacterized protein n=1 Tax=Peronosclerospora sorghi TaxID=230839 RepID=A0ACC0WNF5_9STRA|nr:hypothetical protein PsorP6_016006 [Peronosclerospora sorghi]